MADDKDRENPEERRAKCGPASSRRAERLVSVFTSSEKQRLVARSFRGWDLQHVDFSGADLRGTKFVNMSLQGCDFSKTDLRGAAFIACDLRRANFDNAIFGYNRFEKTCLINATGISEPLRGYIAANGGSFWYC
jgi:uncharacterized protein YjbI with pentapeptide repeats